MITKSKKVPSKVSRTEYAIDPKAKHPQKLRGNGPAIAGVKPVPRFSKAFFEFMDEMDEQTRKRRRAALAIIRAHAK